MTDRCSFCGCKEEVYLTYITKPVCKKHWLQISGGNKDAIKMLDAKRVKVVE